MRAIKIILLLLILSACERESDPLITSISAEEELLKIPEGFPEMEFTEGNELTQTRWDLGKKLFYEKRLSIDNSISCASCHKPSLAFADELAFSPGVYNRSGLRNVPSLTNVGYQPYLLREGSVPTLEMQVLVPIQEHNEFNHNIVNIVKELKQDSIYSKASEEAYSRSFDGYVLSRALAVFQRTMVSGNSAYDRYALQKEKGALNDSERRGLELFFSAKTNCSGCHSGFNFTDYSFQNNGLDSIYNDNGRFRLTRDSSDLAKFKVPSLRNVGLTPPYMHDGRFSSLEEVINHYNSGGQNHRNRSKLIYPLLLTANEKTDLIAFLNSLTDYDFVNDDKWREEN